MEKSKYPHYAPSNRSHEELKAETQRLHDLIDEGRKAALRGVEEMLKRPYSQEQRDEQQAGIYFTDGVEPPEDETPGVKEAFERVYRPRIQDASLSTSPKSTQSSQESQQEG